MYRNTFTHNQRAKRRQVSVLAGAVFTAMLAVGVPSAVWAQSAPYGQSWYVAAGPLDVALRRLAEQARLTITFTPAMVAGKTTQGVTGGTSAREALERLLEDTGLIADEIDPSTFSLRIEDDATAPEAVREDRGARGERGAGAPNVTDMREVTVTGTRIRGAPLSSPLVMISQEEMRLAGHNRMEDVIRAIPQNFSGGQNPGVVIGAGGDLSNQNITGAATLNLRGLGPDATLSLLNGSRLSYDGFAQATDVAVVPVAAIDRLEVLLDGASAIYGTDAVAGVANIILKRDFDGAELSARYGEATAGGYEQTQISAVVGNIWRSGGLMIAAETTSTGAVTASQRSYLDYIPNGHVAMIYPQSSQQGGLISAHQELGARGELTFDGYLTKRSMKSHIGYGDLGILNEVESKIQGAAATLRIALSSRWNLNLNGVLGDNESTTGGRLVTLSTGAVTNRSPATYRNRTKALGLEVEGGLWNLPAGEVRGSFGGGWRALDFALLSSSLPITSDVEAHYGFGEISLPLISDEQGVALVHSLSANAAVRYEDYDVFGSSTTPKLGVVWELAPGLMTRVSWGKSFKVPTLYQQAGYVQMTLQQASSFAIPGVPADATVITLGGANRNLEPERAEVVTAGVTFRPDAFPGASLELGWFKIDYTQRIMTPFAFPTFAQYAQTLNDPSYASFIIRNPNESQQAALLASADIFSNFLPPGTAYDPSKVVVVFDNRNTNTATQALQGIDLSLRKTFDALDASWSLYAAGSWITESKRRLVAGAAEAPTTGIVAFAPRFNGRLGGSWNRGRFTFSTNLQHIGGVRNTSVSGWPKGDSMTAVDFILDLAAEPDSFAGVGFNLSVANAFNQRPPFLAPTLPFFVNYDSTNYSALGRVVTLALTKHF